MCNLRPCPPCPPPPCPSICPVPPQPYNRGKPTMRGLHAAQTKGVIGQALALAALGGICVYVFVGRARRQAYKEFHANAEVEEWAEEMAAKGLFQSVPLEQLEEEKGKKKK